MASNGNSLTPGQLKTIERMARGRSPARIIAATVGCKSNTVMRRCRDMGWPLVKERAGRGTGSWTDERVERLKALWADGYSAEQIAGQLGGVTRSAVIAKIHRLGLARRSRDEHRMRARIQRRKAVPPLAGTTRYVGKNKPTRPVAGDIAKARLPEPPANAPAPKNLTLLQLRPRMCRWPVNNGGPFRYCGHRIEDVTQAYCPFHKAHRVRVGADALSREERELVRALRRAA